MTPAETNKLIAERVMGWKVWQYDQWLPNHQGDHKWLDDPQNYPYITAHKDGLLLWREPNEYAFDFDPYYDERDCMRALEKMREKGWYVRAGMKKDGWYVMCETSDPFHTPWLSIARTGPTFCAAACEAMLKATEENNA